MTPSEGVGEATGRSREMLESLLGPGGLVLLRGAGRRHGGAGAGLEGRKRRGRAVGHSPGGGGDGESGSLGSHAVCPPVALPRLGGVGGAQPPEGARPAGRAAVSTRGPPPPEAARAALTSASSGPQGGAGPRPGL